MTAKEYLQQYRKLKSEERSLFAQLLEAKELCGGLKSPIISDMPKSYGNGADLSVYIARVDAIERKWRKTQEALLQALEEISRTIDAVDDPVGRTVLRMRYISGRSWVRIAVDMEHSERWVYMVHDDAISKVVVPLQ